MAAAGKSPRAPRAPRGERHLAFRLALLVTTLFVSSLVLAALLLPVVGGVGLAAKGIADHFEDLPDVLTEPPLNQRTVLLDDSGKELVQLHGTEDRIVVQNPNDIPPVMKKAIVAIEDSRFYEHHGVDFQGVLRALVNNSNGGATQGASTITQQYVKNVLEESAHTDAERKAATADTTTRKIQEARYALELERKYSKDEILLRYLNIANFGDGVYGVGTAVQHYFHTTLNKLTLPEAALLAGIVNSPTLYNPFEHPVAAKDRRDTVLDRMEQLGYISETDKASAEQVAMPVRPKTGVAPADACENTYAPFYCFYVRNVLSNDTALGDTQDERNHALYDGGLRIKTTLDEKVQDSLQAAVDAIVPKSSPYMAIIAAVEPGTGKVLGIAANRTYTSKKGVGNTKLGYLGYQTTFQGGSTFKLFTLAAALSSGLSDHTTFYAPGCYTPTPVGAYDVPGQLGACPGGFQNSDPAEAGTYDMVTGTWFSVNTYFVQLEAKVGVNKVIQAAESMGVNKAAFKGLGGRSLSVTLGAVNGVSPLEEATAYATIAAHGIECTPNPIISAQDPEKNTVQLSEKQSCRQVLQPDVADTISGIMQGVLTESGATAAGKALTGRVAAGKTGTLDQEKSAWFSGFTPQIAMSVVIGNPASPDAPLGYSSPGVVIPSTVADVNPVYDGQDALGSSLFGGTLPATIWQKAMNGALLGVPAAAMPSPVYGSVQAPLNGYPPGASPEPGSSASAKPGKSAPPTKHRGGGSQPTQPTVTLTSGATPPAATETTPAAPVTTAPAPPASEPASQPASAPASP